MNERIQSNNDNNNNESHQRLINNNDDDDDNIIATTTTTRKLSTRSLKMITVTIIVLSLVLMFGIVFLTRTRYHYSSNLKEEILMKKNGTSTNNSSNNSDYLLHTAKNNTKNNTNNIEEVVMKNNDNTNINIIDDDNDDGNDYGKNNNSANENYDVVEIIPDDDDDKNSNNNEDNNDTNNTNMQKTTTTTTIKEIQKENYRNGTGLILNIHITHHGGTTFCGVIGKAGPSPDFACMEYRNDENNYIKDKAEYNTTSWVWTKPKPWTYNMTNKNVNIVRKSFHMISWEFGPIPNPSLSNVNWENPNLISVIIMRHPIDRSLAGDAIMSKKFGRIEDRTYEQWWEFANMTKIDSTNNFALARLTDQPGCCPGEYTDRIHLQSAKELLQRFTYVLNIECLDDGMIQMAKELNINITSNNNKRLGRKHVHPSSRERIGHDDVYEYLLRKNHIDIELYEWSKTISLVQC